MILWFCNLRQQTPSIGVGIKGIGVPKNLGPRN
jgi:hypothetical protein